MGWIFRQSVRILPGVRLNFGKTGMSVTVGVRGAHYTIGRNRHTFSVGIPGSGISYRETITPSAPNNSDTQPRGASSSTFFTGVLIVISIFLTTVGAIAALGYAMSSSQKLPAPVADQRDGIMMLAEATPITSQPVTPTIAPLKFYVTTAANLRSMPDSKAPILKVIPAKTQVTQFGRQGNWIQVGQAEASGWIHQSLLREANAKSSN